MDEQISLAEGVYRLGGALPLDGRVSWYPAEARGYAPSNAYLFTSADEALLVDPGLPTIEEPLLRQLRALLGDRRLSVLITRPAEFDCITNLATVLTEFPVEAVYGHVYLHQFIGFLPRFDPRPEEEDAAWDVNATDWRIFAPGGTVEFGGRTLELVRTPLRLLATTWLYDPATRVMLTSDTFNHVTRASAGEPAILRDGDPDATTVDDVRQNLLAKFDWLANADTRVFTEGIGGIFAGRDVETIAPAHGCVLAGSAVVERHVELLLDALREMSPVGAAS